MRKPMHIVVSSVLGQQFPNSNVKNYLKLTKISFSVLTRKARKPQTIPIEAFLQLAPDELTLFARRIYKS